LVVCFYFSSSWVWGGFGKLCYFLFCVSFFLFFMLEDVRVEDKVMAIGEDLSLCGVIGDDSFFFFCIWIAFFFISGE